MNSSNEETPPRILRKIEENFGKFKGGKLPTELWFQDSNEEWEKLPTSWNSLDSRLIEYRVFNLERIRKVKKKDFQLTIVGESIWEVISRNLELEKENSLWIPKNGSTEEKHYELVRALNWLLNKTSNEPDEVSFYLSDEDLYILVFERLLSSINHLRIHYLRDKYPLDIFHELKGRTKDSNDSTSKIIASCGLEKLKALFVDLEEHKMISLGSADLIDEHFKENLLDESGSNQECLIDWVSKKYEFVHMIRILRFNKWIIIKDSEVKLHFLLKGKLCQIKHFSIKDTDNLKKIKEILSKHNL